MSQGFSLPHLRGRNRLTRTKIQSRDCKSCLWMEGSLGSRESTCFSIPTLLAGTCRPRPPRGAPNRALLRRVGLTRSWWRKPSPPMTRRKTRLRRLPGQQLPRKVGTPMSPNTVSTRSSLPSSSKSRFWRNSSSATCSTTSTSKRHSRRKEHRTRRPPRTFRCCRKTTSTSSKRAKTPLLRSTPSETGMWSHPNTATDPLINRLEKWQKDLIIKIRSIRVR